MNTFCLLALFLLQISVSECISVPLEPQVIIRNSNSKASLDWRTRSIYQVLTDRFAKTEASYGRCNVLTDYCGGTFKGILRKLDFIADMGFNAIWISPIPENTDKGYHGYWAKDLYSVNSKFGSSEDLKALIKECHARDIWVMLDVVANHMGNTYDKFAQFSPFNSSSHYHKYCLIKNYENQREVEYCRIGDQGSSLADLDTENNFVISELSRWVKWVVEEFDFDAIRVDTVKHVRKEFWGPFTKASGVFSIGEALHGDPAYVGPYQWHLQSMLNFPLYFTIRDVFQFKNSMWNLEVRYEQNTQYFRDVSVLGNFIDNHDFKRFCNQQKDRAMTKNALTYIMLSKGIPVVYQGTEYFFDGGDDPHNRESMWPEIENKKPPLADFFKRINRIREIAGSAFFHSTHDQVWTNDDIHVVRRGPIMMITTNVGSHRSFTRGIKVPTTERFVNVLDPHGTDELVFKNREGDMWWADVNIKNGEPKVYFSVDKLTPYWNEFFTSLKDINQI